MKNKIPLLSSQNINQVAHMYTIALMFKILADSAVVSSANTQKGSIQNKSGKSLPASPTSPKTKQHQHRHKQLMERNVITESLTK